MQIQSKLDPGMLLIWIEMIDLAILSYFQGGYK
jgi:hypothetical protein